MKKEDFKYGDPKYYIDDAYVLEKDDYALVIEKDIFNEETISYAEKVVEKYLAEKDKIMEFMLKDRLTEFYGTIYNYSNEYILEHIGRPFIRIDHKNDGKHPNWKFQYMGIIDYLDSTLDEHLISIEFIDNLDLDLRGGVQMNG